MLGSENTVVLFKTPPSASTVVGNSTDSYAESLNSIGYNTAYVRAIEQSFDTSDLEVILGEAKGWDGVIITSRRGAEGWIRAARCVAKRDVFSLDIVDRLKWSSIPLYTVGQTAIDALDPTLVDPDTNSPEITHFLPYPDLTARSASDLIPLILDRNPSCSVVHTSSSSHGSKDEQAQTYAKSPPRRFLFVRGDKSLETIQPALRSAGHTVHEVEVYTTRPSSVLAQDIHRIFGLDKSHAALFPPVRETAVVPPSNDTITTESSITWLAFFSPSSAGYILPLLPPVVLSLLCSHHTESTTTAGVDADANANADAEPKGQSTPTPTRTRATIRIAAIGETTRHYLHQKGIIVHAVAQTPDAAGLASAIQAFDAE